MRTLEPLILLKSVINDVSIARRSAVTRLKDMLQYCSIIFGNVKARFSDTLPTRSQRDFNSDNCGVGGIERLENQNLFGAGMPDTAHAIATQWTRWLWPTAVAGLLLGAVVGGMALHAGAESQATALVRIHPARRPGPDHGRDRSSRRLTAKLHFR